MITLKSKQNYAFIFLFVTSALFNSTFADGSFFPTEVQQIGNTAQSPNQRAIIIYDGVKETMIVQVKYHGNVQDFGWVVPLASLPENNSVQVESDSIFSILHDYTQPKVYLVNTSKDGRGGGGGELGNVGQEVEEVHSTQVQVWQNLAVGPYDVNIISGTSSQALKDWLKINDYAYSPEADVILDFYIQKNWYFMAIKVNIDSHKNSNNSTYQAGLPALKVTFPAFKPVFPLRISEISSAEENEIEIYVVSDHRMISDSYRTYAMDRNEVDQLIKAQIAEQQSGDDTGIACACRRVLDPLGENKLNYDYESIYRNKLSSLGSKTFIIENVSYGWTSFDYNQYPNSGIFKGFFDPYFEEGNDFWITRLRTILSPEEMIDDVTFIPDPGGDESLILHVFIDEYNPWNVATLGIPLLFLFPIIISKKIRQRYWKHTLIIVVALYLIGI